MLLRRGFSLVEVMVAAAIFLLALSALTSALTSSSATGTRALHLDAARDMARLRVEELLAAPPTSPLLTEGAHSERRNDKGALDGAGRFTVAWDVAAHPSLAVKKLALRVTWSEGARTETVALETMR